MKFTVATTLLLLSAQTATAFTAFNGPTLSSQRQQSSSLLQSTLVSREQDVVTSSTTKDVSQSRPRGALSMSIEELATVLGGKGRAQIAWDCYSIGIDPANFFGSVIQLGFDDYETISSMLPSTRRTQSLGRDTLQKLASLYPSAKGQVEGGVASISHISRSADSTTKMLLKLADGLEVEAVIIPFDRERSTLCISSQVGCKQGCTFCATGRMGKLRNLSSDEILAQMFFAKKIARLNGLPDISNIVFMGMGEPADNSANVINAAEILTKRGLFQLSQKKVVVSTVGPTPDAFKEFGKAPIGMAWSVHAVNDDIRKRLVPTTKFPMTELRQGLIDALNERPQNSYSRTIMLEVAMMSGVNDSMECADDLAEFAQVIVDQVEGCKLIVNLIPFNDIGHNLYARPSTEAVETFKNRLRSKGIYSQVRATRGDDKTAACGQLATNKKRLAP